MGINPDFSKILRKFCNKIEDPRYDNKINILVISGFVSAFSNKTVVTTTKPAMRRAKVVDRVKSDIRAYGG